jgi:hypothetical protein
MKNGNTQNFEIGQRFDFSVLVEIGEKVFPKNNLPEKISEGVWAGWETAERRRPVRGYLPEDRDKFFNKKRAFIKDTYPPIRSLSYFYESKLIFNKITAEVYTFKEFKKENKEAIESEYNYQKEMKILINKLIDENNWNEATDEYIKQSLNDSDCRIADYEKKLSRMKEIKNKGEVFDIEKIKEIPITTLVKFNSGGFSSCIWHSPDKTPSMKYYPKQNKVHCFSCGKDGDVIDVFQQLYGCDFREAIKQLSKN